VAVGCEPGRVERNRVNSQRQLIGRERIEPLCELIEARRSSSSKAGNDRAGSSGSTAVLTHYYGDIATFGNEASGSDSAAILAAMRNYLSAIAAGDWGAACGQLSSPIQHQLEALLSHAKGLRGHGSAAALSALLSRTPDRYAASGPSSA
jgi:hypothetical protein